MALDSELGWRLAEHTLRLEQADSDAAAAQLQEIAAALAGLYQAGSEAVQAHILNTVVEHVCESSNGTAFAEWKRDPDLAEALGQAEEWGVFTRRLRELLLELAHGLASEYPATERAPAISCPGLGSAAVRLRWDEAKGPHGVTTILLEPSEELMSLVAHGARGQDLGPRSVMVKQIADPRSWIREGGFARVRVSVSEEG